MSALQVNPQLLLQAFAETAADLFPDLQPRKAWLKRLRNAALTGLDTEVTKVIANLQDWSTSGVSNESSSTQWLRELSALSIAELAQATLNALSADEAAGGTGNAAPGDVRFADFSTSPCILG